MINELDVSIERDGRIQRSLPSFSPGLVIVSLLHLKHTEACSSLSTFPLNFGLNVESAPHVTQTLQIFVSVLVTHSTLAFAQSFPLCISLTAVSLITGLIALLVYIELEIHYNLLVIL